MNLNNSFDKPKISNLTKNLQQHQNEYFPNQNTSNSNDQQNSMSNSMSNSMNSMSNPNNLSDSIDSSNTITNDFTNFNSFQSLPNNPPTYSQSIGHSHSHHQSQSQSHQQPSQSQSQSHSNQANHSQSLNNFKNSFPNSLNYLPSTHNTPNIIGSSYSSNSNSYKYSHPQGTQPPNQPTNPNHQNSNNNNNNNNNNNANVNSFNPSHSIPTTNVNLDNNFIPNFQRNSLSYSVPNQNFQNILNNQQNPHISQSQSQNQQQSHSHGSLPNISNINLSYIEPDHYMSYTEFFNNLTIKPSENDDGDHLNIIDYPVNDLILMLSCLLTKIIEANDKLHPNHFDNTIAIRQKLKLEKRKRRDHQSGSADNGENYESLDTENLEDDDLDEDDEMKNKYLANVLAFHGTNIPGISLHAYLSRVLKYCPVTNEVFLSLLVYFDRIAKKANNLKKDKDQEQLFVMDSYNIHRLIISGITISSKFFSDIFYKNLRYAKVGGLPLEELNYLELQFLLLLDFKLMISVEDLQNYGDLLLRFWKREQITNQLINNDSIIDQLPQQQQQPSHPKHNNNQEGNELMK